MSTSQLGPGDTYTVQVYTPHPSAAKLARAGTDYPSDIRHQDLELTMPQNPPGDQVLPQRVVFPTFHSKGAGPQDQTDPRSFSGASAIHSSPYWPVYNTAQSLVRTSKTPYAYVQKVMGYLTAANGFSYDEYPPPTAEPLVTFLTLNHLGYCQQFAGSMALLLRMGGIPARVVTGFTSGSYDSTSQQWLVTDVDAHAWVEAWFPHYGWVSFDPTPAAAPARGGRTPITATGSFNSEGELTHPNLRVGHATGASRHDHHRAQLELARHGAAGDARGAGGTACDRAVRVAADRPARSRRHARRTRARAQAQRASDHRWRDARGGRAALPHLAGGRALRPGAADGALRRRLRRAHARAAARPARSAASGPRARRGGARPVGAATAPEAGTRTRRAPRAVLK